jgi:non-specific serine/threonine protein kinase
MLAHYRILAEIGRGGMGVVYEAVDATLDRRIALKVLPQEATADPDRLERFRREAKAVAALNHPGIVTIHSVEEAEGIHFLTMELVRGTTLHDLIQPGGLPRERLFQIAVPLAEALSAAHERGIVHRDLKPSNILVTDEGGVKVLDFGLAKLAAPPDGNVEGNEMATRTAATGDGRILGTFPYMSPEQVAGRAVDPRSDIFSLGIILYEMATGKRPFAGESTAELASSILRDRPASLSDFRPDLPGHLGWILRRCLEKDPRRRYQSALDIRNELEDLKGGIVPEAPGAGAAGPAGAPGAAGRKVPRKALIVAGLVVLAGVAIAWVALWDGGPDSNPAPAAAPAATAGMASIAILPFVNISADPDNEYFSDGMTGELINALVKVQGLKVPARTTVFALKGKDLGIQEIASRLGVDSVLEGSVRKAGNHLRINVQLVRVADGNALWSEQYDREMKDVFAVQDEITRQIVATLRVRLTPVEERTLARPPTENPEAYDLYLKGRRLFFLTGRRNLGSAREMFLRAIEIDPRFALAYAGIADTSAWLYLYSESTEKNLEEAKSASFKALELAPDLAEAHASRGLALSLNREYDTAAREFETALRLDPKLFEAYYFYARSCWAQGLWEQAAQLFEQAMTARPEDYQAPTLLVNALQQMGRTDEAARARNKALELIRARLETNPDDTRALYLGGILLVETGDVEAGLDWGRRAMAVDPADSAILYNVACIYSKAGRIQEAVDALEKAVGAGFAHKDWIANDSDLDPLRSEPRFQALVDRLR